MMPSGPNKNVTSQANCQTRPS